MEANRDKELTIPSSPCIYFLLKTNEINWAEGKNRVGPKRFVDYITTTQELWVEFCKSFEVAPPVTQDSEIEPARGSFLLPFTVATEEFLAVLTDGGPCWDLFGDYAASDEKNVAYRIENQLTIIGIEVSFTPSTTLNEISECLSKDQHRAANLLGKKIATLNTYWLPKNERLLSHEITWGNSENDNAVKVYNQTIEVLDLVYITEKDKSNFESARVDLVKLIIQKEKETGIDGYTKLQNAWGFYNHKYFAEPRAVAKPLAFLKDTLSKTFSKSNLHGSSNTSSFLNAKYETECQKLLMAHINELQSILNNSDGETKLTSSAQPLENR